MFSPPAGIRPLSYGLLWTLLMCFVLFAPFCVILIGVIHFVPNLSPFFCDVCLSMVLHSPTFYNLYPLYCDFAIVLVGSPWCCCVIGQLILQVFMVYVIQSPSHNFYGYGLSLMCSTSSNLGFCLAVVLRWLFNFFLKCRVSYCLFLCVVSHVCVS